jgi:hypothetical protein
MIGRWNIRGILQNVAPDMVFQTLYFMPMCTNKINAFSGRSGRDKACLVSTKIGCYILKYTHTHNIRTTTNLSYICES